MIGDYGSILFRCRKYYRTRSWIPCTELQTNFTARLSASDRCAGFVEIVEVARGGRRGTELSVEMRNVNVEQWVMN